MCSALARPTAQASPLPALSNRFARVRARSQALAARLSAEDAMVQSMPDASPAKWHLAHTTWFFERFVLMAGAGQDPVAPQWHVLFNSYYTSVGPAHARPQRGLLSRPTLAQVLDYRAQVDARVLALLESGTLDVETCQHVELGLQHEQQHQELLLTDIKHAFWCNPLQPAFDPELPVADNHAAAPLRWLAFPEHIGSIGAPAWPHAPDFAYDNESPRHRVLVPAHAMASRPVSNAEFRAFIQDGGYRQPRWWLSEGWETVQTQQWQRPLYWDEVLQAEFTLGGWRDLHDAAPVCHLSYYEADAYARWAQARLPTEQEWETAAAVVPVGGNLADAGLLHPAATATVDGFGQQGLGQLYGDVWEWTSSAYGGWPGFQPFPGNLGEYNGKFMCGQWVLRGGSCLSPADHVRASYRNFFDPSARWQMSGLRLAREVA